jgi:hypothetical protein
MQAVDGYFTAEEVGLILRVSPGRVSQFKRQGRIKPAKYVGRMPLFPEAEIIRFAAQERPNGRPKKKS